MSELATDVVRLVIAARIVAYENQRPEALRELDEAAEAFAERVPWEDEPARRPSGYALRLVTGMTPSPTTTPDSLRDVMGGESEGNTAFGLQPCGEASPDGEVFGHDTQRFDGKDEP